MARVALVDDHPLFVAGESHLLAAAGGFDVVAIGRSSVDAVEIARRHTPDLLIMDLVVQGDALGAISEICRQPVPARVLVLTGSAVSGRAVTGEAGRMSGRAQL